MFSPGDRQPMIEPVVEDQPIDSIFLYFYIYIYSYSYVYSYIYIYVYMYIHTTLIYTAHKDWDTKRLGYKVVTWILIILTPHPRPGSASPWCSWIWSLRCPDWKALIFHGQKKQVGGWWTFHGLFPHSTMSGWKCLFSWQNPTFHGLISAMDTGWTWPVCRWHTY